MRQRSVIAWAELRGAVSLVAALALPEDFPDRADLVIVTLVIILVTLLVHGLTLPAVGRWARLPTDPTEANEQRRADDVALSAGLAEIPAAANRLGVPAAEEKQTASSCPLIPTWCMVLGVVVLRGRGGSA